MGVSSQTDRDNKKGERWLCCLTAVAEGRLHGRPLILHKERATLCRIVPETVLSTHTHAPPSTHERMTSKSSCGRPRISLGSPQQDFINRSRKFNYRDAFRALNPWTRTMKVDRMTTGDAHMERSPRFISMVRMAKNAETASTLVITSASISSRRASLASARLRRR